MRRTIGSVLIVAVGFLVPVLTAALVSSDEPMFGAHSFTMRKLHDSHGGSRCVARRILASGRVVGASDGKPAHWDRSANDANALPLPLPDPTSTGEASGGNDLCILGTLTQNRDIHSVAWDLTKDGLPVMPLGPTDQESVAYDINAANRIAGGHGDSKRFMAATRGKDGPWEDIPLPAGYPFAVANAINDSGDAAGDLLTADGKNRYSFFLPHGGQVRLWGPPAGYTSLHAAAINGNGNVALTALTSPDGTDPTGAFVFIDPYLYPCPTPQGFSSTATGICNHAVTGNISSADGTRRFAVLWPITSANNKPVLGYQLVQDLVQSLPNGTTLYSAADINDKHEITGQGVTYTGNPPVADVFGFVLSPNAAPSSSP